jgi:DNA mismatch endonuclease (patch repair protein)
MADVFSKRKRSHVMAAIRSKGNKETEMRLAAIFRVHRIKGWRRHRPLPGKPDFIFPKHKLAIFVDGCFWHGCRQHLRMPQSNRAYWKRKIAQNMKRDRKITRVLRKTSWQVVRIWEHSLRVPDSVAKRIKSQLMING